MYRKPLKKYEAFKRMKTTGTEDTSARNNPAIAIVKQSFLGCVNWSSADKDIVNRQTKKRVEYAVTDTPHFVIYEATTTTDADDSIAELDTTEERPSFAVDESAEVSELVPELMDLHDRSDLTYVTDLSESVFFGCESDVDEFLVLNSTHEELDIDDSRPTIGLRYDDHLLCPFCSCISPASFNLSPVPSCYAESCLESTHAERSTSQLSCFSDELDSFFDLSFLQNEQYSPYVQRTYV